MPQDRRRLFLVGARKGTPIPEYPKPTTPRLRKNGNGYGVSSLFPNEGPSVTDAISDLPDIEEYDELLTSDVLKVRLGTASEYALRLRGDAPDLEDFSYRRELPAGLLTGCLRAGHTAESRRRFTATKPGATEPISRFFRLPPDGLCNTLRAGTATDRGAFTSPRPIHPHYARCISIREAARLHSYPDWFRFHRTIWHGFRQVGNSVPPLLGRAVAAQIVAALGAPRLRPTRALPLGSEELASMNMREAAAHFGVDPQVIAPRQRIHSARVTRR